MIAWSNASQAKPNIENGILSAFEPISQIEISWDQTKFLDNFKIFYSHSQKHCDEETYNAILSRKIKHCGNDDFTLFVFKDENPIYETRKTSNGLTKVNSNVFDFKNKLRKDLGGGHLIHASDNTFESNKDLTLLLGLNTKDFLNKILEKNDDLNFYKDNCVGVDGYKSIDQLFYVLNNTIDYCVLRNYECLPADYTIDGHGDIDLLVEDLNYIKYLTLASNFYPKNKLRVHYGINISNQLIPFDFRYVGDDYYDENWQLQILKTHSYHDQNIKVPNSVNYFYTLLYHAYVHKKKVKQDYFERLRDLGKKNDIYYNADFSSDEIKHLLDKFLNQNNFSYTIPKDISVHFNRSFLNLKNYKDFGFKNLISSRIARLDNQLLVTEVYEEIEGIVKCGDKVVIGNEIKFLKALTDCHFTPRVLSYQLHTNDGYIVMEKLKGVDLNLAIKNPKFWKKSNIISFFQQILYFNKSMIEHNIMHRDLRPENILINFDDLNQIELYLIDFGWASEISALESAQTPKFLGGGYYFSPGNFSDMYSCGKILAGIFKRFSFNNISTDFLSIIPKDYDQKETLLLKMETIQRNIEILNKDFIIKDYAIMTLLKNRILYNFFVTLKAKVRFIIN